MEQVNIAVVIPCYKVKAHILSVLAKIPNFVSKVYVVDDACPELSGFYVEQHCQDERVNVLFHKDNLGVGGATMTGYRAAITDKMQIVVKLDGDGQMDPANIPALINPILSGTADYTKGNRFYDLKDISVMPKLRLFGNAVLSFFSKLSTGYWSIFDPANGFTAIHTTTLSYLPLDKISQRYFFESDMLFRLSTLFAVIVDVPMTARYGSEISNLRIRKVIGEFAVKHVRNFCKRIIYNYYLRDFSFASIELPLGIALFLFGIIYGGYHWEQSIATHKLSPAGTVMLAALPIILGLQFLLSFISHDMHSAPRTPFHSLMGQSMDSPRKQYIAEV